MIFANGVGSTSDINRDITARVLFVNLWTNNLFVKAVS